MIQTGPVWGVAPVAVLALLAVLVLGGNPSVAQPQPGLTGEVEPLVQSRPRRARPQIRVYPRYPYRRFHSLYPLPYDFEYPGPNARRDCAVRYVQEFRPSGTVVVPRVRCWWVRG
jgi:hypothetical protein